MEWILLGLMTVLFLILCLFVFTIPGYLLLNVRLQNEDLWKNLALSTTLGFVTFTLLSYLLMILQLNILILPIILVLDFIYLKNNVVPKLELKFNTFHCFVLIFFTIGVIGQLLVIAPSGSLINNNLSFWSALGRDGVWHLSLVEELQKGFPWQNPDFSGNRLLNYHFFSDIPIAQFNYFFKIPVLDLFFHFYPLLLSFLLGSLSFSLGKIIGKNSLAGFWAMVFTFFAGSFGFILTLIKDRTLGGESIFWSSQVQSSIGNPPQIIAFIIVLAILICLSEFLTSPRKRIGLGLVLLIGVLTEFKIYGAVVLLISLFIVSLWRLIKIRKIDLFLVFLLSAILAAALYLPNTSGSEGLLLFEPWWFIRTMVVATDKLNWLDLELRRQTYLEHHSYLRVAQIEIEAFLIFLLGNMGMRFLGFGQLFKFRKNFFKNYFAQFIALVLLISLVLPMLFVQKGVPANTIQFFQYFLLIFGILAGVSIAQFLTKISSKWLQIFIGLVIILLAIPTQIGLLKVFYSRPAFAQISNDELVALKFLQHNSMQNAIILSPPFIKKEYHFATPPIWLWSDTSYISAFSSRRTFVSDTEQLDIMGYNYKPRQEIQKEIFTTTDLNQFYRLLTENKINYLYFPKALKPVIGLTKTSLQKIYENSGIEIWKVN